MTMTTVSQTIAGDSNQRSRWPSSRTMVRHDRPADRPSMPSQSVWASSPKLVFSCGTPRIIRRVSAAATGTLMKKHHCHEAFSVSQPPIRGPNKGPISTIRPNRDMPTGISLGPSRVRMMVWAEGISAPPKKPWPTRPMIIVGRVCDRPHSMEKTVNRMADPTKRLRRPSTRCSHAVSGIITTSLTR